MLTFKLSRQRETSNSEGGGRGREVGGWRGLFAV